MRRKNNFKKEGAVYLRKKEKIMLNMLLRNGRTFNTAIARKLKISSQVTGRIRKKLEGKGVIKGYSIELDNRFLGIDTFVMTLLNIESTHEDKLKSENLIGLYRVLANSITHVALYGFRNLKESDDYFHSLIEHSGKIKIINTYAFPSEGLIKHSSKNLFYNAFRGFDGIGCYSGYSKKGKRKRMKKLTSSERKVLQALTQNSNMSCKKISSNLSNIDLTDTGVYMIKNRLEKQKIIRGYDVNLDYEKLGVNIFAFVFLSPKSESLKQEEALIKRCHESSNVISCYRLNEETAIFCGFKDLTELENYCHNILRSKYSEIVKIEHVHIISPKGILKESFDDLYLSLLN